MGSPKSRRPLFERSLPRFTTCLGPWKPQSNMEALKAMLKLQDLCKKQSIAIAKNIPWSGSPQWRTQSLTSHRDHRGSYAPAMCESGSMTMNAPPPGLVQDIVDHLSQLGGVLNHPSSSFVNYRVDVVYCLFKVLNLYEMF